MAITNNNLRVTTFGRRNQSTLVTYKDIQDYIVNDSKRFVLEFQSLAAEDVNLQVQIDAIIAGDIYDEITLANLVAKRTAGTLVPAKAYKITDLAEPLIVYAIATNKIGFTAYSPTYPQDKIIFNTSNALSANWKIIYREDTINHLIVQGVNADFRTTPLFGAGCTNCTVVNWNANTITIGANSSNIYIDMTIADQNIAIAASTTNKRLEEGFSNFEATLPIDGLTIIDLTGKKYAGIINMTDASELSSEQIDSIINASGNHPVTFRASATMTTDFRDKTISGGNIRLEGSPTTITGNTRGFATFEKIGVDMAIINTRNYLY